MPKRRTDFRSKTQWITQPRDKGGRWARIGGVFKGASKGVAKVGSAIARANGVDVGYALNPWKASAGGNARFTREIGAGFSSTTEVTTRIHRTDNKSPFARTLRNTADAGLGKIGNRRAQGVARAVTGVRPQRIAPPVSSSVRIGRGGVVRSKSKGQRLAEQKSAQRKQQKKLRKRAAIERARSAGSTGQPSTITKGVRPQRRKKAPKQFATTGNVARNSASTRSYKHLVNPYKRR